MPPPDGTPEPHPSTSRHGQIATQAYDEADKSENVRTRLSRKNMLDDFFMDTTEGLPRVPDARLENENISNQFTCKFFALYVKTGN